MLDDLFKTYAGENLLSEDGLIFISIDEHESHNLRKICDEVFGLENFISQIVWEKRYTRSNNAKRFTTLTEPVICYAKSLAKVTDIKENVVKRQTPFILTQIMIQEEYGQVFLTLILHQKLNDRISFIRFTTQ